jgi:predicted aspartyl protease
MGLKKEVRARAMIDSGASDLFLHKKMANAWNLRPRRLRRPIPMMNVDDSPNSGGRVTHFVDATMTILGHRTRERFYLADIGSEDLIIGVKWLKDHNPEIDWKRGKLSFSRCQHSRFPLRGRKLDLDPEWEEEEEEELDSPQPQIEDDEEIYELDQEFLTAKKITIGKTPISAPEKERDFRKFVPKEFHSFRDVFSEEGYARLPDHGPYDLEIELEEGKAWPYSKVYATSARAKEVIKDFLKENLENGRIRPSKSHTTSPVFIIKKKELEGRPTEWRMVVDYAKLNAITRKDRYPLPMTQRLLDWLAGSKFYSALDIRWGYHNIRMKEGDEHKAAFITEYGTYYQDLVRT